MFVSVLLCKVLHSLSVELSQYLPLLLKLVVVVYGAVTPKNFNNQN
jgi:hypothetical protein